MKSGLNKVQGNHNLYQGYGPSNQSRRSNNQIDQGSIKKSNFIEDNKKSISYSNKLVENNKNSRNWSNIGSGKPETRNGASRVVSTPLKSQVPNKVVTTQKTNQTSLQKQRHEDEKRSKQYTDKIQAVKRPTRAEAPKNNANQVAQVTYPKKGIHDEIHHFDNKHQDQNIINSNYNKQQKSEIPVHHVKQLRDSQYDEVHNYYASPPPNPGNHGRDKDKYYRENKYQNCQSQPKPVEGWKLSHFQDSKVDKQENVSLKSNKDYNLHNNPIDYQSQQQIFKPNDYQNRMSRENQMNNPLYQSENPASIAYTNSQQVGINNSKNNIYLQNQAKISENSLFTDEKSIKTSNTKQTSIFSNGNERTSERPQRNGFEDNRKIIHPYDAIYDVARTDNPYNYRIVCTPKTKSLVNCNSGLPNIGNTCYMNAVLQILASTEGFDGIIACIRLPFFTYLANVLNLMKSKSGNLSTAISQFKDELGSEFSMFQGYSQNDSKELFQIIVSKLVDEKVSFDLFSIKKKKIFLCSGHEAGSPDENSSFFVVPTGKAKSIQDYIRGLKNTEFFTGKNGLYCDRCGCCRDMRVETETIETSANLAFYLTPASASFTVEDNVVIENNNYRLYGVICHIGTNISGHYFAYTYCESEKSWVEYNDSMVNFVEKPNFRNAYMLFYKNKN